MRNKTELLRASTPETRNVSSLRTHPNNPRLDERAGIGDLVTSIRESGLREPIVINEKGTVYIGNRRYRALTTIAAMEAEDRGNAPIEDVPALVLPEDMTTEEGLSLLGDHAERPLSLPEIGREIGLHLRAGMSPMAAARAVADQAAPIFSRGRSTDSEKGAVGRYQTLRGLAVPEVQKIVADGADIPPAAALRKIGALDNARRELLAGRPPKKGKTAPQTADDATAAIAALLSAPPAPPKAKANRPASADIDAVIVALAEGDETAQAVRSALLWVLGREGGERPVTV